MEKQIEEDSLGSLEHAREALYSPIPPVKETVQMHEFDTHAVPHGWKEKPLAAIAHQGEKRVRMASIFFGVATLFFLAAVGIAGYFFYFGSNYVGVDKITVTVIPNSTTIAGGDPSSLAITVVNKNPVAIENATIEIDFPEGTRSAADMLTSYPRYFEKLGTIASGATVTRSVKAVMFGSAGQTLTIPVIVSYGTSSSNAVFQKKTSYALSISSTPLSIAVDALTEAVSGDPVTFTITVRSNATIPLTNVVLNTTSPFGFSVTKSSLPLTNSSFLIGTLAPGESKQVVLTGTLTGQDNEQRVFHFTVGTAKSAQDQVLAVTYMTQDATVIIGAPFITTTLSLNGDSTSSGVIAPGSPQSVSLSYTNTLKTTVTNASVTVGITGSAVDYNSIRTMSGFYNSADHTIVFSKDTDPSLAGLAPGASGIGSFTFSTLPAGVVSPTVTLTTSVSGTRVGQSSVPEQVTTTVAKTAKVMTVATLSSVSSRTTGGFSMTGPIPPRANQATTYAIVWNAQNKGSAIAGGIVTATLPTYVTYTGKTSGKGSFSYDSVSRTMTWNTGDLAQGASAQAAFQISLTPSTSQKGGPVELTSRVSFSGYDRFAGVQVSAVADSATTETKSDVGYSTLSGVVQ